MEVVVEVAVGALKTKLFRFPLITMFEAVASDPTLPVLANVNEL